MSASHVPPLSLPEAAQYLGVSTKTIRRLVSRGDLPAYRLAGYGRLTFLPGDLDALLVPVPTVVRNGGGKA